jgi:hypothetical protein
MITARTVIAKVNGVNASFLLQLGRQTRAKGRKVSLGSQQAV